METKAFEIRDVGTFIPVIATRMLPTASPSSELGQAEYYLLRRSGYRIATPGAVMLCRMNADGNQHQASADAYGWGRTRTMTAAHEYIEANWDRLSTGDVIDVEFILKESSAPKLSERLGAGAASLP